MNLPEGKVLLAVSGGLDSMVLLHFFERFAPRYKLSFDVAHADHGLRPSSADEAQWLVDMCKTHNHLCHKSVLELSPTQNQSSVEALARSARYQWFQNLYAQGHYQGLLTAHHANDQLETVLMRFVRGSVSGLVGVSPERELLGMKVFRPFLGQSRRSLVAYAQYHQLSWVEDETNAQSQYFRNRVRQRWVPLLEAENPNIVPQVAEHALIWQAEEDLLETLAAEALSGCETQENHLNLGLLAEVPVALQRRLIKRLLTRLMGGDWKIYTSKHLESILNLCHSDKGKYLVLPQSVRVTRLKTSLFFEVLGTETKNDKMKIH